MKTSYLYSTAVLLLIGGGAAIAQSPDISQKREEPRAQTPAAAHSKEMDRPAAADRMKERAQSEQKGGAKEMQRGEAPSERSKQAQEPQGRESKEPTRQSQDQPAQPSRERAPSSTAQQKDGQQGRDAKQSPDQKQQAEEKLRGREGEPKQDRAHDANKPADTKQQTQQQVDRDRKDQRDQAAQPSGTSTGDTAPGQKTGQAPDQSNRQTSSSAVNDDQRRQVVDQLRRDRAVTSQNLNIQVNVGTRLPPNVQARRLPSDIVRIMPQYRDYDYTVIDNRVAIIDPRGREVVEILDDGPGYGGTAAYGRDRIVITDDTRTRFRELVRSSSTTVGSTSPSGGGTSASNCLSLQPVPEELARTHPELSSYRYLAIGDQVVLVDPQQQKIVQVLD